MNLQPTATEMAEWLRQIADDIENETFAVYSLDMAADMRQGPSLDGVTAGQWQQGDRHFYIRLYPSKIAAIVGKR
jgi:hypothetical protein